MGYGYGGGSYGGGYGDPYGGYGGPGGDPPPPNNQLVGAILTTIFCCLPFGIVSIVYAARVNTQWMAGDFAGAYRSAELAKKWWMASLWSVVGLFAIYLLLGGLGAVLSSSGSL